MAASIPKSLWQIMAKSPKTAVHPLTLLRMFKELGYEKAVLDGAAIMGEPLKSDPVRAGYHQPIGTVSEIVPYRLKGKQIAICHQYRLPNGSLGASGLPDPKML